MICAFFFKSKVSSDKKKKRKKEKHRALAPRGLNSSRQRRLESAPVGFCSQSQQQFVLTPRAGGRERQREREHLRTQLVDLLLQDGNIAVNLCCVCQHVNKSLTMIPSNPGSEPQTGADITSFFIVFAARLLPWEEPPQTRRCSGIRCLHCVVTNCRFFFFLVVFFLGWLLDSLWCVFYSLLYHDTEMRSLWLRHCCCDMMLWTLVCITD